jgi:hypothetical protein
MGKRLRDSLVQEAAKKQKTAIIGAQCLEKKRPLALMPHAPDKRRKLFEYWHTKPHTREQRAAYMAAMYEHLLCQ